MCSRFPLIFVMLMMSDKVVAIRHSSDLKNVSVNFAPRISLTKDVGGVFCEANHRHNCAPQKCDWSSWYKRHYEDPDRPVQRVVVSWGHCGFGNQIFQNNFAQMTAEQTDATFYISKIPDKYVTNGLHWAESKAGYNNIKPVVDPKLLWENLPANHSAKILCSKYNVTIGHRPVDRRSGRPEWNKDYYEFIDPAGPAKCMFLVGFFQEYVPCLDMRRNLWKTIYSGQQYSRFSPKDVVIHMRCLGGHYPPPNKLYIEAVLNRTKYEKLYIFKPPGPCRNGGRKYDNTYIIKMLEQQYGAEYYSRVNSTGLSDFLDLSSAYQIIETSSTYSFWSGMFSNQNATIHVDISFHRVVPSDYRFIYHNPNENMFYGTYDVKGRRIKYKYNILDLMKLNNFSQKKINKHAVRVNHSHTLIMASRSRDTETRKKLKTNKDNLTVLSRTAEGNVNLNDYNNMVFVTSSWKYYLVENSSLRRIPDQATFRFLNFTLNRSIKVSDADLNNLPFGVPLPRIEVSEPQKKLTQTGTISKSAKAIMQLLKRKDSKAKSENA